MPGQLTEDSLIMNTQIQLTQACSRPSCWKKAFFCSVALESLQIEGSASIPSWHRAQWGPHPVCHFASVSSLLGLAAKGHDLSHRQLWQPDPCFTLSCHSLHEHSHKLNVKLFLLPLVSLSLTVNTTDILCRTLERSPWMRDLIHSIFTRPLLWSREEGVYSAVNRSFLW